MGAGRLGERENDAGCWMMDAGYQFRLFPLKFCLHSRSCFHAFQIQSLLRVSAPLRFLIFELRVGVEQSGLALRFPPHSKSVRILGQTGGQPQFSQ
jgi:hypothetical protein